MKEKIVLILGICLFITGVALASYFVNHYQERGKNEILDQQEAVDYEKNQEESNQEEEDNLGESGVISINEESFSEEVLQSQKPVLVDFYADWCVPCQHLSPIVEEVATEHPEIKFVKMNVDEAENIANQYGVIYIPTLVFIKNGEQVGSSIGLVEKEAIVELISQ